MTRSQLQATAGLIDHLLPADLLAFLDRGSRLQTTGGPVGRVTLVKRDRLRIGCLYAGSHSRSDPHHGTHGVYRIPAISLLARCEHYDPDYLLSFLLLERKYCVFDGDHARVTVFTQATWPDIAADPNTYFEALFQRKTALPHERDAIRWWNSYAFYEDESF